jgi:nucleoside-diphosphate-sugar epimerase
VAYVEHCAAAALDALSAARAEGRVVNLVDDELPTRAEYVTALATRTVPEPRVMDVPWPLLNAGSAVAWSLSHGLLRDAVDAPGILHPARLHARSKPVVYSNALAKDVLGWRPQRTWREALARSFEIGPGIDAA